MNVAYNEIDYFPPAPVLDVEIASPGDDDISLITEALLDTGADVTVVPAGIPAALALPKSRHITIVAADGQAQVAAMWHATIRSPIGAFTIEVAEMGEVSILGRDVLNRATLRLDGPNRIVSVI